MQQNRTNANWEKTKDNLLTQAFTHTCIIFNEREPNLYPCKFESDSLFVFVAMFMRFELFLDRLVKISSPENETLNVSIDFEEIKEVVNEEWRKSTVLFNNLGLELA